VIEELVPDELWEQIAPLLPRPRSPASHCRWPRPPGTRSTPAPSTAGRAARAGVPPGGVAIGSWP